MALALLVPAHAALAGTSLRMPQVSPKAFVGQTIGLTDVTVAYHRPTINKRAVWGTLVPYGQVWRAGANENTTVTFSTPVTVEGKPLAAGTYGLHMIPGKDSWTVIFSTNSTSWGSFTYDEKEDALRVSVKPHGSEFREELSYEFEDVTFDSAVLALEWEKLTVPVRIGADTKSIAVDSFKKELRSIPGNSWEGFVAASYGTAEVGGSLEQALKFAEDAVKWESRYDTWKMKADILRKMGRNAEAETAMAKALELGTVRDRHLYARKLLEEKKVEEAFALFQANAAKYPGEWITKAGLARGWAAKGDFAKATKYMKEALAGAPEEDKKSLQELIERLGKREDING
jgi:Protein of unknown function (DUF2911)